MSAIECFTSSTATTIDVALLDKEAVDGALIYSIGLDLQKENDALKQRIKRLEEFARTIENDFDHDEDAHRYGTTCRVCDAEDLLKETKAKEAKL